MGLVCLSVWATAFATRPMVIPHVADSWIFPLGDDGYVYAPGEITKHGIIVKNTNYGVRNLDLRWGIDGITCFGVGAHRLYNAGVDLYRVGSSTAGAEVKAVADGYVANVVPNYPGYAIILRHILPDGAVVYSLYGLLNIPTPPMAEVFIPKGTVLGTVMPLTYIGNFPEFHPDGDNAHLHFEIRTFADATTQGLPATCDTQYGPAGVGHVYPNRPNSYGYLDPLAFLRTWVPANRVYLPITRNGVVPSNCQQGRHLIQNTGFEDGTLSDPSPWVEVSTLFAWNAPLISTVSVQQGQRAARLGGWNNGQVVDETLEQSLSFIVPANIYSATWKMIMDVVPDNTPAPDLDDYFVLTMNDAYTGRSLLANGGFRLKASDLPLNGWFALNAYIFGMNNVAGRKINLHYSAWSDETRPTFWAIDNVDFITHCTPPTSSPAVSAEEELQWEVTYTPLPENPSPTVPQDLAP